MGEAIQELRDHLGKVTDVRGATALLSWDQSTMMPPEGAAVRGARMQTVATIAHEMFTSTATGELLDRARREVEGADLESDDYCLVETVTRDWKRAQQVPDDLAGQIVRASSEGYEAWQVARKESDFSKFLPYLERNLELKMKYIDCFEPASHPYDTLVEDYEYGLTSAEISKVFDTLKGALPPLVNQVITNADKVDDSILRGTFSADRQRALCLSLLEALGFEDSSWRLDPTAHPFESSMAISDIRLTTRYDEEHLSFALFSSIHEFGHGLYERQIAPSLERTPIGGGCSMTLHESQSRMWENSIGRSAEFWTSQYPLVQKIFPEQFSDVSASDFVAAVNKMSPSLIRVEADELTYGYHLILRFEIEMGLVEGKVKPAELPELWNAKIHEYFGIDVPNDAVGVLQDVHWSGGDFGYFPTYLLGSVLAAQVWNRLKSELTNVESQIQAGEFEEIRDWLRQELHQHGRKFTPKATIERVAGGPLDPQPYIEYLTAKVEKYYA